MATEQKFFNSLMPIASVKFASAFFPASGEDATKVEGEATGLSGTSDHGTRYLNFGFHCLVSRAADTGTLGCSSSIFEVIREYSRMPVVEEALETPLQYKTETRQIETVTAESKRRIRAAKTSRNRVPGRGIMTTGKCSITTNTRTSG